MGVLLTDSVFGCSNPTLTSSLFKQTNSIQQFCVRRLFQAGGEAS